MAAKAAMLSTLRQTLLGTLLEATLPPSGYGRLEHGSLWVNEAMHRAYNMVRLVFALDCHASLDPTEAIGAYRVAVDLVAAYRSLGIIDDRRLLPCSGVLRTIASDVVELFGPITGEVGLQTAIERLALPAFKRRALVLAASELLINSLLHGFVERDEGNIVVTLRQHDHGRALLRVADDGCGLALGRRLNDSGVAFDMAALLEARVMYRAPDGGGTVVEIDFRTGDYNDLSDIEAESGCPMQATHL